MKTTMPPQLRWSHGALLVLVVSMGCRGTGRLPGSNMFSWNRQPDPATLAGTTVPELPVSPASKYDPTAITSLAAKPPGTGTSSSPAATLGTGNAAAGSAYAYGNAPTTGGATPPATGLAAAANGYQTGPYQLPGAGNASTGALPNPYGGSYAGTQAAVPKSNPPTAPSIDLPSSVASALQPGASPSGATGMAAGAAPGSASLAGPSPNLPEFPMASAQSNASQGTASAASYTLPSPGTGTSGPPAFPPLPTWGTAADTNAPPTTADTSAPSGAVATTAPSSHYPGAVQPASNEYSPGSTGRTTGYDFGGDSVVTPAGGSEPTSGVTLPPNTASGMAPLVR